MSKHLWPAAGAFAGLLIACQPTESYYYAPGNDAVDRKSVCLDGFYEVRLAFRQDYVTDMDDWYRVDEILGEMDSALLYSEYDECIALLLEAREILRRY
jgi:hypothetical protein